MKDATLITNLSAIVIGECTLSVHAILIADMQYSDAPDYRMRLFGVTAAQELGQICLRGPGLMYAPEPPMGSMRWCPARGRLILSDRDFPVVADSTDGRDVQIEDVDYLCDNPTALWALLKLRVAEYSETPYVLPHCQVPRDAWLRQCRAEWEALS